MESSTNVQTGEVVLPSVSYLIVQLIYFIKLHLTKVRSSKIPTLNGILTCVNTYSVHTSTGKYMTLIKVLDRGLK